MAVGMATKLKIALPTIAIGVILDQWSKTAVFEWLEGDVVLDRDRHGHARYPLFAEQFGFMLSLNRGAAFGRFGDFPHILPSRPGIPLRA